ncbi:MAG: BamA/TamA family outer membrane protein [Kofleriaceae bacterium]
MVAKQLLIAASLVVLVGRARAQSAPPSAQPDDEASSAPGNTAPVPIPLPKPRRAATGTFALGVGFNTDDGFIADVNITQSDLFGTGKLLSLDARLDERSQRLEGRYVDPELAGTNFQLDTTIYTDLRTYSGFDRQAAGTSVQLSHLIAPHVKAYAGYRIEHVDMSPDDPTVVEDPRGAYDLAALRAGLEYNTLDQPFLATRGARFGSYVEVAAPELGSDVSMVHTKSYAEAHHALGPMILHVGGSFETVAGANGLPEGELLHFDGSSQLRGFAPNGFGPRDDAGRVIGGTMAFYGHTDLELPLSRRYGLSAIGFVDGGGLFGATAGELGASTGLGFVWRSPIGPIGAYWAWPSLHDSPKFVFGVGTAF